MFRWPYLYNMTELNNRYTQMYYEILHANMRSSYDNIISYARKKFTMEEAVLIGKHLGIRFDKFDVEEFTIGLNVELEHGSINPITNVTNDDPILTGKIALAHLDEFADYYKRLDIMEEEAEKYWGG